MRAAEIQNRADNEIEKKKALVQSALSAKLPGGTESVL